MEQEPKQSDPRKLDVDHGQRDCRVMQYRDGGLTERADFLAVEEPMEIRCVFGPDEKRTGKSLSITMRTPGNDYELAAGFLLTEGIVQNADQIQSFEHVGPADSMGLQNTIRVYLKPDVEIDYQLLQRHFYTTSSCGVCGKASLDAINVQGVNAVEHSSEQIGAALICGLPDKLREAQTLFESTGGIHAAGLFDFQGNLISMREDVGRHNAMDKLIGDQLLLGQEKLSDRIIVVSGRASFELLQKALVPEVPVLVAVGAPSSLAVDLAERFNMTLIGFTSSDRFNIYAGASRIR